MTTIRIGLLLTFFTIGHLSAPPSWVKGKPSLSPASVAENVALRDKEDKKEEKAAGKPKGKFTVGKDTTYVTGPLDKNGYLDYAAALNQRLGQGVTPASNANVLLWKALGPHPEAGNMPAEFFQLMGIEAPAEKGVYFIPMSPQFLKEHFKIESDKEGEEIHNQSRQVTQRPWTTKEHPQWAAWLKANEKQVGLVVEATKREKYFSPLVPDKTEKGSSGLLGARLSAVQKCREFANALTARAMLRINQGDYDKAWQDLLACHRLGRLVGRGATLIEGLVGIAIDSIASRADLAFLEFAKPDAKQIEIYLGDLQRLPGLPDMAEKVGLGERLMCLDCFMMLDRHGTEYLEGLANGGGKDAIPLAKLKLEGFNWDPALKNANRIYDRLAAAMRDEDRKSRAKELDEIDEQWKERKAAIVAEVNKAMQDENQLSKALSKAIGDVLTAMMMPAAAKIQNAADRANQGHANLIVAFALNWYQRDHGSYPKKLDELAPRYLKQMPKDIFSGKALIYRPKENGYLLYSVGVNGKDDGGQGYEDQPAGDDLSVRMPLPELTKAPEKK